MMRALDLFSGAAGGWSLGWHRAGFSTVAACEIDPARRAAFAHNNPDVLMYDDIRNLSADRLRRDLGYFPEAVIGSPPCQDASTANPNGKGIDGERTGLFKDFIRIIGEGRPRWVAAENVPGFRTRGADWVLGELEALGYTSWPCVVGAIHTLAPHERRRVWFIAADTDQVGIRIKPGRSRGPNRKDSAVVEATAAHDLDADRVDESDVPLDGEVAGSLGLSSDTDEARLAQRQGQRSDTRSQLAALERAVGPLGYRWNGSPAGSFGMADGVHAGLARQCVAAYGDAVLPQITEAIANAIRRTEQMLAAA